MGKKWSFSFAVLIFLLLACGREDAEEAESNESGNITNQQTDSFTRAREQMVEEQIIRNGVKDEKVLAAMRKVPRHQFVPRREIPYAYEDRPLDIGHGQTISQPYMVAVMTELLQPNEKMKALEVGTGSGYQAAILAEIIKEVKTIEIIKELGDSAKERLKKMKYENIEVKVADGYYGWEEHAPFDIIIVTAAVDHIPPPLIEQLGPGGRLVIPVGNPFTVQDLVLAKKDEEGRVSTQHLFPVRFVPLTGRH